MADFLPHPLDGHSEPRAEWTEAEVEKAARALNPTAWQEYARGLEARQAEHQETARRQARSVLRASGAVPRAKADRLQRDADRVDRAQYHVERANTAQALLTEKAAEVAKLSVAYVKSEEQLESAESQLVALRARCEGVAKELRYYADRRVVDTEARRGLRSLANRLDPPPTADEDVFGDAWDCTRRSDCGCDRCDSHRESERVADEIESLKVQGHAAANLLRRRTEELDTLREWCRERGYLPDDLPRPKSFDRELHDRLAPLRRDRSGSSGRPEKETG